MTRALPSIENPLLSRVHASKLLDESVISMSGFETGQMGNKYGIRRKVYQVDGEIFNVAEREISGAREAMRVMDIYSKLRSARLPVVTFAKSVRRKNGETIQMYLAMEDLTKGGQREAVEIGTDVAKELLSEQEVLDELQNDMTVALAVMHNNGIVDFHPGISFVLVADKDSESTQVSFRIIDYSNLTYRSLPEGWNGAFNFDEECEHDFDVLAKSVDVDGKATPRLQTIYQHIRDKGVVEY